jgi:hypothetical protein
MHLSTAQCLGDSHSSTVAVAAAAVPAPAAVAVVTSPVRHSTAHTQQQLVSPKQLHSPTTAAATTTATTATANSASGTSPTADQRSVQRSKSPTRPIAAAAVEPKPKPPVTRPQSAVAKPGTTPAKATANAPVTSRHNGQKGVSSISSDGISSSSAKAAKSVNSSSGRAHGVSSTKQTATATAAAAAAAVAAANAKIQQELAAIDNEVSCYIKQYLFV